MTHLGPPERISSRHLRAVRVALDDFEASIDVIERWGGELARRLTAGARLLTAGNGGSAAHAEHLAAEFVGRYATERAPFSAVALHCGGVTISALTNDYGADEMFARQVRAHGRPGDVLVAFSTSGHSPNVVAAAGAACAQGLTVWSLTGPGPNPLTEVSSDSVAVRAPATPTVQEIHQIAVHLLCEAFDESLTRSASS
ncbi:MAG: SIS domain-containing protein [Acidobacteriota bacterium]|nr:SIS domain-containing protein [Acidobacteriota bacterium]